MESKVLSPNPDCVSDPEEKEISDDDDDDRNHKHRRRDTRSQSLEGDASEQVLARPFRKNTKPFGNGYSFRGSYSHSSETWKSHGNSQHEKDFPIKLEKRRSILPTFSQTISDLNQRIRVNQPFYVDHGSGRGRGWDPRFSSVNVASQLIHQGPVPPSLFAGRGLPTVSNSQNASWGTFGLIPGIPNGSFDGLHSLGLPGTIRPSINPSLNVGIPRQRCRDFEERGFCLRGDMCPMEHGGNQIVVEDVQSLSQFNLPVSLPSAHILGNAAGPGPGSLPSVSAPSSTLIHSKGIHSKSSKRDLAGDRFSLNDAFSGSAGGADLYDPDQPLWNDDRPETSSAFLATHSPNIDETSLLDADSFDHHLRRLNKTTEINIPVRSSGTTVASHGSSSNIWGRIGGSKNRIEMKKTTDLTISSSNYSENEMMKVQEALADIQGNTGQGKENIARGISPKSKRNVRRPSQKALRTLFVNGIPQKSNKADALFSHFRKFGEVIDIYIPSNSERAFVQFSKSEEAEAALMAPDAVMGNRFIKLWWANRDSIPDDGISSASNTVTPCSALNTSVPACLSVANTSKDGTEPGGPKVTVSDASDVPARASDHSNPFSSNSPKALQKKLVNLELLKELRKKQEMLDQKRLDFRRQLNKLEKATGFKGEVIAEQCAKKQKLESAVSFKDDAALTSSDMGALLASEQAETTVGNKKSGESVGSVSQTKVSPTMILQEATKPEQHICPSTPVGTQFVRSRYKSEDSPTAFRIIPPLPAGFANVTVLKEHFLSYGDLFSVELEESETLDSENCSALINFTTRQSAEGAFLNGKCWQGHNLQFIWLTSSKASNEDVGKEKCPAASGNPSDASIDPDCNLDSMVSEEAVSGGNGETGNSERSKGGVKHMEQDEEFQSSSVLSSDKQSSIDKIC